VIRVRRIALTILIGASLASCSAPGGGASSASEVSASEGPDQPTGSASSDDLASSDDSASSDETESAEEPYEAPVLAAVSAALGADLTDIYEAVLAARRPFVADCVSESGWTVSNDELDALFDPGDPGDSGTLSGYIDLVIDGYSNAPVLITDPPNRQRTEQIVSCMDRAEANFPNPNMAVLAAIEEFDRDVTARVASDARVAEAKQVRDECASGEGVPSVDGVEPIAELSNQVTGIQEAVGNGTMTTESAVQNLRSLQITVRAVEACYSYHQRAFQSVVDEVQELELERRPDLVPSIVAATEELMDQYRALLSSTSD
jgi:hypothetical protein